MCTRRITAVQLTKMAPRRPVYLAVVMATLSASSRAASFCGTCANGGAPPMTDTMLTLSCTDAGATIASVTFASYGTPSGACGNWRVGACNAPNSTSIVAAACIGRQSCVVWPNTTTFGDPCFGTKKELAVELVCSAASGTAVCATPPPTPPVVTNFTANVSVTWGKTTATLRVEPSVQVVSQHFLFRDSPIAAASWASLKLLGARHVRFVPWIPYARVGVAELDPPSGPLLCGPASWAVGGQKLPVTLDCGDGGGTINAIQFASFGQPTGSCGAYADGPCSAANSTAVVQAACLGKTSCVIPTNGFGNPCGASAATWLGVQATCSEPAVGHTYWNFTHVDAFFLDFWNAVGGNSSEPIPNFSTAPSWLYDASSYTYPEDASAPWYGYDRGTAPSRNLTALADYYGRLYAWYIKGTFIDEYGRSHTSGHALNISLIEVYNEPDYEHGHTKESYVLDYDAQVRGVRAWADPTHAIRFVGMNLPNIDDASLLGTWAEYFLNASNHASDVADAVANGAGWVGYHAYPTNGGYTPDPNTLSRLFDYADSFIAGSVATVDAAIARLSPGTRTALDETGTDMDNVLTAGLPPPTNNPRYWVASAGYFAYMFCRVAVASPTVRVLGASQLMDAPGQEPSVSLLDWTTGQGTARFWVVKMLIDETSVGDVFVQTTATSSGAPPISGSSGDVGEGAGASTDGVFAQGFISTSGGNQASKLLLINKRNGWATVSLEVGTGVCLQALVIDEDNGLQPARSVPCNGSSIVLAPFATALLRLQ